MIVDNHECQPTNPSVAAEKKIRPSGPSAEILGDVELHLKVAKAPLDPELQGVSVFANGVWLETTLAGGRGQSMSDYIFGEIDVPRLDDEKAPIPAYDMSRCMELNPK